MVHPFIHPVINSFIYSNLVDYNNLDSVSYDDKEMSMSNNLLHLVYSLLS